MAPQPLGATLPKPTVREAIPEYLAHLRSRNLSEGTIRTRRISLLDLARDVGTLKVYSLAPRHLDAIFAKNPHWSPGTRNNRLSHYKHFFGWCRSRGYMARDNDPTFGWKFAKMPNPERLRVPLDEWPCLYAATRTPRDRIVLSLGLYLFLRANEVKAIQLKDIYLNQGEVQIYRSKTKEFDLMPISSELEKELRSYLTWQSVKMPINPDSFLIPSSRVDVGPNGFIKGSIVYDASKPYGQIHDLIKPILGRAGYPTRGQGEHTLRRSGARAYFDSLVASGYDGALRRVQAMLGHSKAYMTERYLGLDLDRRRRNDDLRGRPMFPQLEDARVIPIREGL